MEAKKKETVVCYYRVSSEQQKDKGSIARQTALLPALCEKQGLQIIGEPYTDDGISGRTVAKRPGFVKILADLPRLKPDFVAFLRPDRIGRPRPYRSLWNSAPLFPSITSACCSL